MDRHADGREWEGNGSIATRLERVGRESLVDTVVERIRELVESANLSSGIRLPTEAELIAKLGVSRTVLREAIGRLESIGLIRVERGRGMFVGDRTSLAGCIKLIRSALVFTPNDLLQFTEFRRAIECHAVRRAAEVATPEQLQTLEQLCEQIDSPDNDDEQAMQSDLCFHLMIAQVAGNRLMHEALAVVQEFTLAAMLKTTPRPRDREESRIRHRRIVEALAARDASRAELAMHDHFDRTRDRLTAIAAESNASPQGENSSN